MISPRSKACPQGFQGLGIRELIRTSAAHRHAISSALKHKCMETSDCCLALPLRLYKSFASSFCCQYIKVRRRKRRKRGDHQSAQFHWKSLPGYRALFLLRPILIPGESWEMIRLLEVLGKVYSGHPVGLCFLFPPCPLYIRCKAQQAHSHAWRAKGIVVLFSFRFSVP